MQRCIWTREPRFETSALTSHGALGNPWSRGGWSSEQQKDLWIHPILPADSSIAFGKVHSLHSWGKLLRFLVICCRHLKPDLCSALSSYLLAYLPGTVKCLRIRLSTALLTGTPEPACAGYLCHGLAGKEETQSVPWLLSQTFRHTPQTWGPNPSGGAWAVASLGSRAASLSPDEKKQKEQWLCF